MTRYLENKRSKSFDKMTFAAVCIFIFFSSMKSVHKNVTNLYSMHRYKIIYSS